MSTTGKWAAGAVFSVLGCFQLFVGTAPTAGATLTKSQLQSKAISLSNLPTGWTGDRSSSGGATSKVACFDGLKSHFPGESKMDVSYTHGGQPAFQQTIESGPSRTLNSRYQAFKKTLSNCKHISFTSGGQQFSGSIGALSFPRVAKASSAFGITLTTQGVTVGVDIVLFEQCDVLGDVVYGDLNQPDRSQVQATVKVAVNKIEGKASTVPPTG
jgi:hypothetical protein